MSKLTHSNSEIHQDVLNFRMNYELFHKENMKWVLHDIRHNPQCQSCNKTIIKYIYSDRGGELICCSAYCVDQYCYE